MLDNEEIRTQKEDIENSENQLVEVTDDKELLTKLGNAKNSQELREIANLFNISIMKKSMTRASAQSELLDDILDRVKDRVVNHHDELSHKELIDYMTAIQNGLDHSTKTFSGIDNSPPISINNTKNDITVNVASNELSRESRERVMDAVKKMLAQIQQQNETNNDIIEVDEINTENENDQK